MLLTGFTSLSLLRDWLDASVDSKLLKSYSPQEMRTGFISGLEGAGYVAQPVPESLTSAVSQNAMTACEREVLSLIATGHSNAAIAKRAVTELIV